MLTGWPTCPGITHDRDRLEHRAKRDTELQCGGNWKVNYLSAYGGTVPGTDLGNWLLADNKYWGAGFRFATMSWHNMSAMKKSR